MSTHLSTYGGLAQSADEGSSVSASPRSTSLLNRDELLISGIWPRSMLLWMAGIWMTLVIIRPWEEMFPGLAPLRLERVFAISMISLVLLTGKLRLYSSTFQTFSVLALVTALFASCVLGINFANSWTKFYVVITTVVLHFTLLSVVRTAYQLVFISIIYIAAMSMMLAKAHVEYHIFGAVYGTQGVYRMVGINAMYHDPNYFAMLTVVSMPVGIALWQSRKEITASWPVIYRKAFPLCLLGYFILGIYAIMLTQSRAGMLAVGVLAFVTAMSVRGFGKKIGRLGLAVALILVTWIVMPDDQKDRLRTLWDSSVGPSNAHVSADGRIEGLKAGVAMFDRFPLSGVGLQNFGDYRMSHVDGDYHVAHNIVGEILGETGALGATAFCLFFAGILLSCRRARSLAGRFPQQVPPVMPRLATGFRNSAVVMLFCGMSLDNLMQFQWYWTAAFALLAWKLAEEMVHSPSSRDAAGRFVKEPLREL